MNTKYDVAVVGAGAAGIAAARRLKELGRSVLVIEALDRTGGRAFTRSAKGVTLDMGCGWLHSAERNPLAALAQSRGEALDKSGGAWRRPAQPQGFPAQDRGPAREAYDAFSERLRSDPPASDRASDALPPGDPWRPYFDAVSGFINGCGLDALSVADFLRYEDASSDEDWRLPGGYGAFIASLAQGLDLATGTRAASVALDDGVTLETDRGTIRAGAAIIAVSTGVLASGAIAFPSLADEALHAASQLPLGRDDKLYLSIPDAAAWPEETHYLGRFDSAQTGGYYLRPLGRPVIECYFGGSHAAALEEGGEAAMVDFALGELRGLFGAGLTRGLAPLASTQWGLEPTILGSYSHALPGCAGARAALAGAGDERLRFAGEACSLHDFSTAHGAWESGIAAADAIEAGLAGRRPAA